MNKTKLIWNLSLLFLVFSLSVLQVFAFQIETLNGDVMEWEDSFCQEDPANYYDLVGDDFYAYCENDFSKEYNAGATDSPLIGENISNNTALPIKNESITEKTEQPLEIIEKNETDLENLPSVPNNNWFLFLGIFGIVLIFVVMILIIAHQISKRKDEKNQIQSLTPYLNNLRKKGYTKDQLEELLIKRGYDSAFINRLLNK